MKSAKMALKSFCRIRNNWWGKYGRKTYVDDIDRSLYDFRNEDKDAYRIQEGLTREIVEKFPVKSMIRNGCWNSV